MIETICDGALLVYVTLFLYFSLGAFAVGMAFGFILKDRLRKERIK